MVESDGRPGLGAADVETLSSPCRWCLPGHPVR